MEEEFDSLQLTTLIRRAMDGDEEAEASLIREIFDQLKVLAKHHLPHDQGSVQATALVHEIWIKIFREARPTFVNRNAFFGYASRAIRNVLIDHIKHKAALKHGGHMTRQPLDDLQEDFERVACVDLMTLNEELEKLKDENLLQFQIVEMRFFGGMKNKEISEFLNVSVSTVESNWALARAKLMHRLRDLR